YDGSDIIRNASMNLNSHYMDDMSASKKEGVFAHELGHVLGLDHVKDPQQVMSTTKDGRKVKEPGKDDIAGIKSIYKK
ncbi:matrixin family metalloprotease, partial [Bacillus thuringiensis]|nr:matrixin family metalloprotease [Bacillus thuringiensis]